MGYCISEVQRAGGQLGFTLIHTTLQLSHTAGQEFPPAFPGAISGAVMLLMH